MRIELHEMDMVVVPMNGFGATERCSVDFVSTDEPTRCSASRMASDRASALSLLAVKSYGDHALGLDLEIDLVSDNDLAPGNREAGLSTNSDGC